MKRLLLSLISICGLGLLSACGGNGSSPHTSAATHFSVAPATSAPTAGTAFSFTVTALDESNSVVTSYAGTMHFTSSDGNAILPANSILTNGTGTFSATLKTSGSQTITATDTATPSITGISSSINVSGNQGSQLTISSGAPPPGTVGMNYDARQGPACKQGSPGCHCITITVLGTECHIELKGFSLTAMGAEPPYSWTWAAAENSSLPPGLSLTQGVISGSPTSAGSYEVIITVRDSATPPAQTSAEFPIAIAPPSPPVINSTNAPSAGVNLPYSFTFTASGGQQPLTWNETGAPPQGLTFSPSGVLSGTPSGTGSFPITVIVQDSAGQVSAPQVFPIQIFLHGFAPTGSMGTTRAIQTATLLNDGTVLVAGGQDASGNPLSTAELYDPASGTFTPTGSMTGARYLHTATLLGNGQVLITGGGAGDQNAIATAELYDPVSKTFTLTGSMGAARSSHTATLVPGGKVLVTGGQDEARTPVATAELYDPSAGTFAATGSMRTARGYHTATMLGDGKVLIAGGVDATGVVLSISELYDPKGGTFAVTGSLNTARFFQAATLLTSGKVLLTGGTESSNLQYATAELYDPNSGMFSPTGSMASARAGHIATLLNDGTVLVAGGAGGEANTNIDGPLTSAELFDPATAEFTLTGGLQTPRAGSPAVLLGSGKVLVAGGSNAEALATAELYQ
jgi:hypothetical protein